MSGNPMLLRTSERRDFLRCQQRWWWAWREGLRPNGDTVDHFWFGTGIHLALATWYCGPGAKRGPHPAETWAEYAAEAFRFARISQAMGDEQEARFVSMQELGRVMMDGYVRLYGRDEHKLILLPEKTFRLEVPWPSDQQLWEHEQADNVPKLLIYLGTFDSAWRHADTGFIWLDEHKTAAQISTGHLTLDPQAGSYWAVATRTLRDEGLISEKDRLAGIQFNFLRKALPDDRPKNAAGLYTNKPEKRHYIEALEGLDGWTAAELRKKRLTELEDIAAALYLQVLGEVSKVQPGPLFERHDVRRTRAERNSQLIRLQREGIHMRAIRDGLLPVLKNPTRECAQGGMSCPFLEMCELHEQGGDWEEYRDAAYVRADPYADHRKGTE